MEKKIMNDFWENAEIMYAYTDKDAINDGILQDTSAFGVRFNGKIINRVTSTCYYELNLIENTKYKLETISINSVIDGDGEDAWGIFQTEKFFNGQKLWLVPNETGGMTLMFPSEY